MKNWSPYAFREEVIDEEVKKTDIPLILLGLHRRTTYTVCPFRCDGKQQYWRWPRRSPNPFQSAHYRFDSRTDWIKRCHTLRNRGDMLDTCHVVSFFLAFALIACDKDGSSHSLSFRSCPSRKATYSLFG